MRSLIVFAISRVENEILAPKYRVTKICTLRTHICQTVAAGTLAGFLVACGPASMMSGGSTTPAQPILVSMAVTPTGSSVDPQATRQFKATATYSDQSVKDVTTAANWSATAGVTISNQGLATAISPGTSTITARLDGVSGSTTLTVTNPVISIAIAPPSATITPLASQQFEATATYADQSTKNVTASASWSATAGVTISARGLATAISPGASTITARLDGKTGSTILTVTNPVISIAIAPPSATIAPLTSQQFEATATYADQSIKNVTASVSWSATGGATVNSSGLATAASPGPSAITATLEGVSSTAMLTVTNPMVSIVVSPLTPSAPAQTTLQFAAIANYFDHTSRDITSAVTWSSSDSDLVTISNTTSTTGLANLISDGGPIIITATQDEISGTAALTVTVAPPVINVLDNSYGIVLFNDGVTDNYEAWSQLQNAVPAGAALYFPKGKYFMDPVRSPFGWVLRRPFVLEGESSGSFDGTTVTDATLFLNPINLFNMEGSQVVHLAIDTRGLGESYSSDGISSGTAEAGNPMNVRIDDVLYVGQGGANPGHGVLIQSGPANQVSNIRAYYAFHAVAVRSANTNVSNIYAFDSFDVVVKSAAASGDVHDVTLANITCEGTDISPGCITQVESTDSGVTTHDVTLNEVFCRYVDYCLVFHTENGGEISTVAVTNIDGNHVGTGIYTYTTGGGGMEQIAVSDGCFQNLTGSLLFNSANADITTSDLDICNP